jgi:hypothetical protein
VILLMTEDAVSDPMTMPGTGIIYLVTGWLFQDSAIVATGPAKVIYDPARPAADLQASGSTRLQDS